MFLLVALANRQPLRMPRFLLQLLIAPLALALYLFAANLNQVSAQVLSETCTVTPTPGKRYTYSADAGAGSGDHLGPQSTIPLTFETRLTSAALDDIFVPGSFEIAVCNEDNDLGVICTSNSYGYYPATRNGNRFTVNLPAQYHDNGRFAAVLRGQRTNKTEKEDICPKAYNVFFVEELSGVPPACTSFSYSPTTVTLTTTELTISYSSPDLNNDNLSYIAFSEPGSTTGPKVSSSFKRGSGTPLEYYSWNAAEVVPTTRDGNLVTARFPIEDAQHGMSFSIMQRSGGFSGTANTSGPFCQQTLTYDPQTGEISPVDPSGNMSPFYVCNQIAATGQTAELRAKCEACSGTQGHPKTGIWTAVGCIQTDAKSIVTQVVQIGLGLAGGVALLMIVGAGFLLSTSQNDPKKVTEAKEMVTSAVIGLLFIIFSVTILQFIGVTILRIPGFGS